MDEWVWQQEIKRVATMMDEEIKRVAELGDVDAKDVEWAQMRAKQAWGSLVRGYGKRGSDDQAHLDQR